MSENITPLPDHLEALRSIQLGDYTLLDYREAAYEGYRLNDWWQDKPHKVLHQATEAAGHEIATLAARVKELERECDTFRRNLISEEEEHNETRAAIEAKAEKARIIGMSAWAALDPSGERNLGKALEDVQRQAHELEEELRTLLGDVK